MFPTKCPCPLKTDVVRETNASGEESVVARCTGEFACPYQRKEHLRHFVSRRAFDIEGLGEKQIELFYESGWVKEPGGYFHAGEAQQGHQARGGRRLRRDVGAQPFRAIDARREIALDRFIYALGIRHVGDTTALALARGYGSWDGVSRCLPAGRQG